VDAGPGASIAFGESGAKFEDLQAVLLTHLHVDHSADLPAFIKGGFFTSRQTALPVYGPAANDLMPATSEYLQSLLGPAGAYPYLKEYVTQTQGAAFKVKTIDVPLERQKISHYSISNAITASATFVHHGPVAAVAWRVEVAGCSIVFSGDMSNRFDVLSRLAKEVDLLVAHNAIPEEASRVAHNLHMSPSVIGKIAKQAQVKKLILSHFMLRTADQQEQNVTLIGKAYKGPIVLAEDGLVVNF
jgi:ribonuclease BN (tRNA processing enzyme)